MEPAPDLTGLDWIDDRSTPVFEDRITLLAFWSPTVLPAVQDMPRLNALQAAYPDLTVIGVCTPRFPFEQDRSYLNRMRTRYDIAFPVALDTDRSLWDRYGGRYWPRYAMIDQDGYLRDHFIGAARMRRIEELVQQLLREVGDSPPQPVFNEEPSGELTYTSPDLLTGAARNPAIGNEQAVAVGTPIDYTHTGEYAVNRLYLDGLWEQDADRVTATAADATITARCAASDVYAVTGPGTATVTLNGIPIPSDHAGTDVSEGVIAPDAPGLHHLVSASTETIRNVSLTAERRDFAVYGFTFQ